MLINQQTAGKPVLRAAVLYWLHRGRTGNGKRVVLAAVVEKRKGRTDTAARRCSECSARTTAASRGNGGAAGRKDGMAPGLYRSRGDRGTEERRANGPFSGV